MRYFILFALLAATGVDASPGCSNVRQNPVAFGLGGAGVAYTNSPFGVFTNPGVLPWTGRSAAVTLTPGAYGLTQLRSLSVLLTEPTSLGTFSLSGTVYGFELYSETALSASAGWEALQGFFPAATVTMYHLRISGYGNGMAAGITVGATITVQTNLIFGFVYRNLNRPELGDRLPSELTVGMAYDPTDRMSFTFDLRKETLSPMNLMLGAEIRALSFLSLRVGGSTDPEEYGGGVSVNPGTVGIDYGFRIHPTLGMTHVLGIAFRPGS